MRIVGGKHRGRKLFTPQDYSIRPTADNVREALFNILGNVNGCTFLDLFGGSGAVALEAVSRGAKATVADKNAKSVALIKRNFELCKEQATIMQVEAKIALKAQSAPFDYIFLDPPYAMDITELLGDIARSAAMGEDTLLIYEKEAKAEVVNIEGLQVTDTRKYGIVGLVFYKRKGEDL